jgi:hypothetical protein
MKRKQQKEKENKRRLEIQYLTQEIKDLQEEMAATLSNFSNTIEPQLLEYYTYDYKAKEIRHSYILKKLKGLYKQCCVEN